MFYRNIVIVNLWYGLTLSILFFYPLIAGLSDNLILFQWRKNNSLELIVAILLFTLFFACCFGLINKTNNAKIKTAILILICLIPFASFVIYSLQQIGLKNFLILMGDHAVNNILFNIVVVLTLFAIVLLVFIYPNRIRYVVYFLIMVLSPINFISAWTLFLIKDINTKIVINDSTLVLQKTGVQKHNVVIILFDELSVDYLYSDGLIKSKYPNFKQLSSVSNNYLSAISPGKHTEVAVPGIIMNRHFEKISMESNFIYEFSDNKKHYLKIDHNNLFAAAKAFGYKTFVYGPYLPYCQMFEKYLDGGRSFSYYNYGAVDTTFSILNPIKTTLCNWPRQKPFGFMKNIFISEWQKKQTDEVLRLSISRLDNKGAIFLFSHLFVTHVPFVFNRNGYYNNNEPFLQDSHNYLNAMEYADYILGEIIRKMKSNGSYESSELTVLADHNYRIMFPGKEDHIPLIIKRPYQKIRIDFRNPVHAEYVLKEEVINLNSQHF